MKQWTLEELKARCIEDGDCLRWQGAGNGKGHGKVMLRRPDGTRQGITARRLAWQLRTGKPVPHGKLVGVTCENEDCLEHLCLTTKSASSRKGMAPLAVKIKRAISCAAANQARLGVVGGMDKAREIRASSKTGIELAVELGISESTISKIRCHKSYKEHSNPMSGLLAGIGRR